MQLKIALFQANLLVGDLEGNTKYLIDAINQAKSNNCNLFIAPELAISGYLIEDLIFRQDFFIRLDKCINKLSLIQDITLIIGCPRLHNGKYLNSALIIQDGSVMYYDKQALPNYSVFDEKRYFIEGDAKVAIIDCYHHKIAILICADLWHKEIVDQIQLTKVDLICTLNASPFHITKQTERLNITSPIAKANQAPLIYLNHVGGHDDVVFDGASFVLNSEGKLIAQLPAFEEQLNYFECNKDSYIINNYPDRLHAIYQALVLSVYDYVTKNNFKQVILGLSGGIDSALTLAIATDALGKDNVHALMMPSNYTAEISLIDAREIANNLGVSYQEIAINNILETYQQELSNSFSSLASDTTDENLQARIRGNLLMAFANKFGYLVLTTGNKSEMATGYATLYGDMAGGFAVLKDVLKTEVYELSNWRNQKNQIIPNRIITRPPSAELRFNQTDQDSLPKYALLDPIIRYIVEENLATQSIVDLGFDKEIVKQVAHLIKTNDYKRKQGAIGPRISKRSFGRDWRYLTCHKFKF